MEALDKPSAYWAPRAVNLHTLAIADCYTWLKQAEHRGELEVIQFTTEPDCHQAIGSVLLTPDAYMEIGNRAEQVKRAYWLEVDRGTEHIGTIKEKCGRYQEAYRLWRDTYFPQVLFVVPDERRAGVVRKAAADTCRDVEELVEVRTYSNLTIR